MLAHCNQCNTTQEIKLDPTTQKPICTSCRKEVTNLSAFTIRSMKDRKEFLEKKKQAFSFRCEKCNAIQPGALSKDKKSIVCSICETRMNVTEHMFVTFKGFIENNASE